MIDKFYIVRTLLHNGNAHSEAELLASTRHIVLLAEPGAGKTELLNSFASQLQSEKISATGFKYFPVNQYDILVLDALDEVSRIDPEGVFEIFAKAQATGTHRLIVSSRSSEWDDTYTHRFTEFFGEAPTIVRLRAFDTDEQKRLFDNHLPNEDFFRFRAEVSRFDLDPLLPNPKFLELFADAYIESERHFSDKQSIFEKAIDRLARETNPGVSQRGTILLEKKIEFANEVFAKLLLSGAEGVALTDLKSSRLYPRLTSLIKDDASADKILDTRLFKPGDIGERHLPVHKIVAEYCAARYLVNRIISNTDTLSLTSCLAVIAPTRLFGMN